ncbi:amino acid carrier protein, partial [Burkholderia multivorans]|nr:amino acid carrier protein [Burkholderia multivorans]
MEALVHGLIDAVNGVLWNYVLIALLLGVGAWFTLRFRMIQLKALFLGIRLVGSKAEPGSISSFQAFATGLASRVGTGNIAGVAVALTVGGPGAIFWMWMTALVGMSSAFVEATLAQIFKVSHADGSYRGGPAYYIQSGLRSRGFGVLFSLSLILAFGFVFNAIADALNTSFGWHRETVGLGLVLLTAPIIFGGIRRIASVAQVIVPVMAIGYLALAVYAVATHLALVPDVIALIVKSAFGVGQAAGGVTGYAVSQAIAIGVKRGLFSNEAGMGSAPNAAATASTRHPVTQGLIQMLGVFV